VQAFVPRPLPRPGRRVAGVGGGGGSSGGWRRWLAAAAAAAAAVVVVAAAVATASDGGYVGWRCFRAGIAGSGKSAGVRGPWGLVRTPRRRSRGRAPAVGAAPPTPPSPQPRLRTDARLHHSTRELSWVVRGMLGGSSRRSFVPAQFSLLLDGARSSSSNSSPVVVAVAVAVAVASAPSSEAPGAARAVDGSWRGKLRRPSPETLRTSVARAPLRFYNYSFATLTLSPRVDT
jgi:hypothetical protein